MDFQPAKCQTIGSCRSALYGARLSQLIIGLALVLLLNSSWVIALVIVVPSPGARGGAEGPSDIRPATDGHEGSMTVSASPPKDGYRAVSFRILRLTVGMLQ